MIRHGANEIFASKDATITDEDINVILERGDKKVSLFFTSQSSTSYHRESVCKIDVIDFNLFESFHFGFIIFQTHCNIVSKSQ